MRVLMVGAGAVGAVLSHHLEKTKSIEVTFLVRAGRKANLTRIKLLHARTEELHVRERPSVIEPDARMAAYDTVILAVRADQLDEAADVIESLPSATRIASASAGADDVARLRARFPGRPVVQILPLFLAFPDGDVIRWWTPPLVRTLVTWEGDEAARGFAEELVKPLVDGGLPAMAVNTVGTARECIYAAGLPMLASFELAGWDAGALGRDRELRGLASRGKRGAAHQSAAGAGLRPDAGQPGQADPAGGAALSRRTQEMWRRTGLEIAAQTRAQLDGVIARSAAASGAEALTELRRRLG